MTAKAIDTPWGPAQEVKHVGEGVTWYSTASHGGFHVDAERMKQMPSRFREFKPWAGRGWYEEDADWAVVCLSFPELFSEKDRAAATETLEIVSREYFENQGVKFEEVQP